jgi:AAA+ ATPase superfamily predicted ATPase
MKFIAREKELEILELEYKKDFSSFVAVYGRRRIGKTELINHFISLNNSPFFSVTGAYGGSVKSHLNNFSNKFSLAFGCENPQFKNWDDAFWELEKSIELLKLKKGSKFIIFIDELPWLAQMKNSGFKSALSLFWNDFASKRDDIFLVVCGSATSWIINQIVNDCGSLANRVTAIIHLESFSLRETKMFLEEQGHKGLSSKNIIDYYMSLGGVAHYLKLLQINLSFVQNIDKLFFQQHGLLRSEYFNLFATLFKNHQTHETIIKHLCNTWSGLSISNLATKKELKLGSVLLNALRELEESGFLVKRYKYGQKKRDTLYTIKDPFLYFFTKWVENTAMVDLVQNQHYFQNIYNSGAYKVWSGFAFENICHSHIYQIKKALGVAGVITRSYYWSAKDKHQGAQIDIVLERDDDVINLIECKFHNKEFVITKQYANSLKNKAELFYEHSNYRGSIQTVMVTIYGVKDNSYYQELISHSIGIEALFE